MRAPHPSGKRSVFVCTVLLIPGLLAVVASRPGRAEHHLLDPSASTATVTVNLVRQPLSDALKQLAEQTGLQLVYHAEDIGPGQMAPAIAGTYAPDVVLTRLLDASGLSFHHINTNTVAIRAASDADTASARPGDARKESKATRLSMRIASADDQVTTPQADGVADSVDPASQSTARKKDLEEVVVTGTYIHDVKPITPVITITHDDLLNQGYSTLAQAIEQLPQNFKAGASQESNPVTGIGNGASQNYGYATGVNLRGLGAGATLVLLNGQRLAPTALGGVTDISQIPISVIDRVEILADGASALYGSDAIAGVVNIVTRHSFSGLELGGRSNSITDGKAPNYGGNVLGGVSWNSGNLVLNFDDERDNPLLARNRSFSATLPDPTDLLPQQEKISYFGSLQNDFSERLRLSSDVLISNRRHDATDHDTFDPFSYNSSGQAHQYNGAIRLEYRPISTWTATFDGQYSLEKDAYTLLEPGLKEAFHEDLNYKVLSAEPRIDGALFDFGGGAIHAALGVQWRQETFEDSQDKGPLTGVLSPLPAFQSSRNVSSAYGELLIPFIGATNALPLVERLRLDLSGRYDHYSEFGNTYNPKISAEWAPVATVSLHGTYAKSFQAPTLYELTPVISNAYVMPLVDPQSTKGSTLTLLLDGNNPHLKPETAKSFTLGATYAPDYARGLKLDASYYSISFDNEINRLILDGFFTNALEDSAILGSLVQRDPSLSLINQALSGRRIFNYAGGNFRAAPYTAAQIAAIANVGYVNSASVTVRGVDFSARYVGPSTDFGHFKAESDASYFTHYDQSVTSGSQPSSLVNTVFNPLRFRAKLNLGWDQTAWAANARLNFSNAYRNTVDSSCSTINSCSVSSWTTVDVSLSYTAPAIVRADWLHGIRASLDITNLFNRNPPEVTGVTPNLNYDPVNANPLLRTIGISISKRWGGP